LSLFDAKGNKQGKVEVLNTMGEVQLSLKLTDAGQSSAKEALTLAKEIADKKGEAAALVSIATACLFNNEKEQGLASAREALLLFRSEGDRRGEATAKDIIASLRPCPERPAYAKPAEGPFKTVRHSDNLVRGVTGPSSIPAQSIATVHNLVGVGQTYHLNGLVVMVTGASRGIGKGIAQELSRAGAIVYVTGRSSPGSVTDALLQGTVDETAAGLARLGGVGVATHVDHAHMPQNQALVSLLQQHGRLDCLVNNAFYIPKPDLIFFSTPIWMQPTRFLNEQIGCGGFNHVATTIYCMPYLRRGKGLVVNISSWGSQQNIPVFPLSYLVNKSVFDFTMNVLGDELRKYNVFSIQLWPGSVKSERSVLGAKRSGAKLRDLETVRFTGRAVVHLAKVKPEVMARYSSIFRTVSCSDIHQHEIDGYMHSADLHTYQNWGNAQAPKPMHLW